MSLEKGVEYSRREFLKGVRVLGIGALATSYFAESAVAQTASIEIFKRDPNYNLGAMDVITPPSFLKELDLTPEAHASNIRKLKEIPGIVGEPEFIGGRQETWVRLEPDRRYATNLIEEANKSIDHLIKFLGSLYLKKPQVTFTIPQKESEIEFKQRPDILVYLVSDLGLKNVANYRLSLRGKQQMGLHLYISPVQFFIIPQVILCS